MERGLSPKRRHILSSFNPQIQEDKRLRADESTHLTNSNKQTSERKRRRSRERESPDRHSDIHAEYSEIPTATTTGSPGAADDKLKPRAKALRLKSDRSRRHRSHRHGDTDADGSASEKRRRSRSRSRGHDESRNGHEDRHRSSRHRSHRRHRRHHRSRSPTPENPHEEPALDPDAAFRESLFDALADDEGAAYWEGVYGQPVHIYASARENAAATNDQGELERMTDDEYAAWVREQMWAKTHQGMLEEKERRAAARAAQQEKAKEEQRRRREDRRLEREVEMSLRAGEERRARRRKRELWQRYVAAWENWDGSADGVPWPQGSIPQDGDEEGVRTFFVDAMQDEEVGDKSRTFKEERVRWHPDKIQQRLGGQVDAQVMKGVTMIFQVLDGLWAAARK